MGHGWTVAFPPREMGAPGGVGTRSDSFVEEHLGRCETSSVGDKMEARAPAGRLLQQVK